MARTRQPAPQIASPDEVEAELYEAMRAGDIERLMAVWAEDEEIVCVHPGGMRLVGVLAIRATFEAMFGNGPIEVEALKVRRVEAHSSAVHSVLERIRVRAPEGERYAWVVATNVYLRSAHGWRLVAHHASPGAPEEDSTEATATLH